MAVSGTGARTRGTTPTWVVIPVVAVACVLTARLGLLLALPPEYKATSVWPPSGIALAALLVWGRGAWPGVWLGAFAANFWDALNPSTPISGMVHALASAGIAAGSTIQAVVAASLVRRWCGAGSPLQGTASVFAYIGVVLGVSVIGASCGVVCLWLAGVLPAGFVPFV
jgi:integral membrane sensor domain MASE1